MAAPVVSGVAAIVLQGHPDWTPDQIKSVLINTSRTLSSAGAPEVNVIGVAFASQPRSGRQVGVIPPNALVDPASGDIDYSRSSWSRSSWSSASDPLTAGFARSSWSCDCASAAAAVDPSRSSWSRSSWSTKWSY